MRATARFLLLLFAFTAPWEYSLDFGAPFGNIARLVGLLLLAATLAAVWRSGGARPAGALQVLTFALFLWMCCTYLWSQEPDATLQRLVGYFQEMMAVWLVWELVEDGRDLRALLGAWLAGSWVLAALTVASFAKAIAPGAEQIRFVAMGQDPNDAARFLDLALPVAALLADGTQRWTVRLPWR